MKFAIIAAFALALPTAAMAQEQEAAPFSGPYVGVLTGYDHVILSDGSDSGSKSGVSYGVLAGYDTNLGGAVVGIEAEVSGSTVKETESNFLTAGDTVSIKAGRDLYIGGRVGVLATPATLIYAKAGYSNGRVSLAYTSTGNSFSVSDNLDGVRVGGGVEQNFGMASLRLEYRYTDYGQFQYSGVNSGVDAKRHQVIASLIARF